MFDPCDPFDLKIDIFGNNNSPLPSKIHSIISYACYKDWLVSTYMGEAEVAVNYNYILSKIKNNQYKELFQDWSIDAMDSFYEYLTTTIDEERDHTIIWKKLIEKIYGVCEVIDIDDPLVINKMTPTVDNLGLLKSIITYYRGETVTLSSCAQLYKYTTNLDKKEFLKKFIQEESKHTAGFTNLFKLIAEKINLDERTQSGNHYHNIFAHYKYFGHSAVYKLESVLTKVNYTVPQVLQHFQHNNWQAEWHQMIIKKNYNFYKEIIPNLTEIQFDTIIESNAL